MRLTNEMKKTVVHQFDSYCKKILWSEMKNYRKECYKRCENEILVDEFTYEHSITEDYNSLYDLALFIGEEKFLFENELLYEAVRLLQDDKKKIILYFYFLDMTDLEIAQTLKLIRRTVNYKRNKALKELRKQMEGLYGK